MQNSLELEELRRGKAGVVFRQGCCCGESLAVQAFQGFESSSSLWRLTPNVDPIDRNCRVPLDRLNNVFCWVDAFLARSSVPGEIIKEGFGIGSGYNIFRIQQ